MCWFMHMRLFPDTETDQSNGNVCTLLILHFKSNFEIHVCTLSIHQTLREIHMYRCIYIMTIWCSYAVQNIMVNINANCFAVQLESETMH